MGGALAEMMFTDPPYGVEYKGNYIHSGQILSDDERIWRGGIENDGESPVEIIKACFLTAPLTPGSTCMVCAPPGRRVFDALECWPEEWHYQSTLVWDKGALIISRWDYHPRHEFIFYGWMKGAAHSWFGGTKESTVWEVQRQLGPGHIHPTQKPVELPERGISNSTVKDTNIYDPFLGSGTTLIACERLNRKCFGVEIEPKYIAVTLQRWADVTGREPVLVDNFDT
jgi:DNA modification methylase